MKKKLTPEERSARNKKRLETYNPQKAAFNAWRREFSRSPIVISMMNDPATKRYYPRYKNDGTRMSQDGVEHLCAKCDGWKRSTKYSKVAIDHIVPVIDPELGFTNFSECFLRLWCERSNLQKLCGECHQEKSNKENFVRNLRDETALLDELEKSKDGAHILKSLKRFTPKKWAKGPYPKEFKNRVERLRNKIKKLK
jgi:hypothetical protein